MYAAMNLQKGDGWPALSVQQGIIDDIGCSATMYAVIANNIEFVRFSTVHMPQERGLRSFCAIDLSIINKPFQSVRAISVPRGSCALVLAILLGN